MNRLFAILLMGYSLPSMAAGTPFQAKVLFGHWASVDGGKINLQISTRDQSLSLLHTKLSIEDVDYLEDFSLNLDSYSDTIVTLSNRITGPANASVDYKLILECLDYTDTICSYVNIIDNDWHRNILVEEGTGTWCGNCPRGIVAMKLLEEKYPESFVGITLHYANSHPEPMDYHEYGRFMIDNTYINAFPQASVNRVEALIDPFNDVYLGGYYELALQEATPAYIDCSAEYRDNYKAVRIQVTGILDMIEAGHDYGFSFCCIENDVHQPGNSRYAQFNNYGNNAYGEFYGFEKFPSYVPADSMWYQEVARYFVDHNFNGITGSIESPQPGVPFTYSCNLTLPSTVINPDNLNYIAMIVDRTTGEILNCVRIEEADVKHGWSVPLLFEDFSYGLFHQGFTRIDCDENKPFSNMGLSIGDAWGIGIEEGNYYAFSTSYYSPSGQSDDWLITPAIPIAHVLEQNGDLKLSWRSRSSSSKYPDSYEVWISTQGNERNDFCNQPIYTCYGESPEWISHEIELDDLTADSIYIAFRNVTKNGEKLLLDDICIYSSIASSLPQTRLNADNKGQQTRIYSLYGQYLGKSIDDITTTGVIIVEQQDATGAIKKQKLLLR